MKSKLIIITALFTTLMLCSCLGKKEPTQGTQPTTNNEMGSQNMEPDLSENESGQINIAEADNPVLDEAPVEPIVYEELPETETPPGTFAENVVYLDPEQFPPYVKRYSESEWEAPPLFLETGGAPYLTYDEHSNIFILVDWQAQPGGLTLSLTAPDGSVYEKYLNDEEVATHSTEFDDWGYSYDPPLIIFFLQPTAVYPQGNWTLSVLHEESELGAATSPTLSQVSSFLRTEDPDPFFDPFIPHQLKAGETARFIFRNPEQEQNIVIYKYESWDEESYTETSLPVLAARCLPVEEGLYKLTFTAGQDMKTGNYRVGLAGEDETLQHVYFDIVEY